MSEKKKTLLAAALKYDSKKDAAPRVTAQGRGIIAEKIIDLARKHDVPIKNDPALVQILSKLELEEQIPTEIYKAVAEIMAFVYSINEKRRENLPG